MAKVGAQRAAELTGRSKSTIQRAMNSGKISFETDSSGRRVIDVSELERAFGLESSPASKPASSAASITNVEYELEKAQTMLEMERFKMRIRILEDQLETAHAHIEDLRNQRDQWQKQASQVLLTSQYTQKEAEQLRETLKEREKRDEERRQMKLEERMQRLKAQNQNASNNQGAQGHNPFKFKGFWKLVKTA